MKRGGVPFLPAHGGERGRASWGATEEGDANSIIVEGNLDGRETRPLTLSRGRPMGSKRRAKTKSLGPSGHGPGKGGEGGRGKLRLPQNGLPSASAGEPDQSLPGRRNPPSRTETRRSKESVQSLEESFPNTQDPSLGGHKRGKGSKSWHNPIAESLLEPEKERPLQIPGGPEKRNSGKKTSHLLYTDGVTLSEGAS